MNALMWAAYHLPLQVEETNVVTYCPVHYLQWDLPGGLIVSRSRLRLYKLAERIKRRK